MPLEINRSFLPDEMIRNFPRPASTAHVEITAPTAIRGEHLEIGVLVEVTTDIAEALVSNGKGRIVPAPAPEPDQDAEAKAAEAKAAEEAAAAKASAAAAKVQAAAEKKAAAAAAKAAGGQQ